MTEKLFTGTLNKNQNKKNIFFFKYLIKGYKNLVPNIEGPVDISVVEILVKLKVKDPIKSRIKYVPCSICH